MLYQFLLLGSQTMKWMLCSWMCRWILTCKSWGPGQSNIWESNILKRFWLNWEIASKNESNIGPLTTSKLANWVWLFSCGFASSSKLSFPGNTRICCTSAYNICNQRELNLIIRYWEAVTMGKLRLRSYIRSWHRTVLEIQSFWHRKLPAHARPDPWPLLKQNVIIPDMSRHCVPFFPASSKLLPVTSRPGEAPAADYPCWALQPLQLSTKTMDCLPHSL